MRKLTESDKIGLRIIMEPEAFLVAEEKKDERRATKPLFSILRSVLFPILVSLNYSPPRKKKT